MDGGHSNGSFLYWLYDCKSVEGQRENLDAGWRWEPAWAQHILLLKEGVPLDMPPA